MLSMIILTFIAAIGLVGASITIYDKVRGSKKSIKITIIISILIALFISYWGYRTTKKEIISGYNEKLADLENEIILNKLNLINSYVIDDAKMTSEALNIIKINLYHELSALSIITDYYKRHQNVFESSYKNYEKWNIYFINKEQESLSIYDKDRLRDLVNGGIDHINQISKYKEEK